MPMWTGKSSGRDLCHIGLHSTRISSCQDDVLVGWLW